MIIILLYKIKTKSKFFKIFIYLFIVFSCLILFLFLKHPSKLKKLLPNSYEVESSIVISNDTIINEIKNVNKLIPLELELSETLIIDNTYFDLDIFKKSKKITFFANCSYCIDFSNLSKDNIKLDNINKNIYIIIPSVDIFNIDIDEGKTVYSDTEVGFLRFGDLKLSSEELNSIYVDLNFIFKEKMNDSNFHDQALSNAEESLEDLILSLTDENYNVIISTNS